MGKPGGVVRPVLIWSYDRGTLQYDIICGLILAFIFFTPRSCFLKKANAAHVGAASAVSSAHHAPGDQQRPGN